MTHWYQILMWSLIRLSKKRKFIKQYNIESVFHNPVPKAPYVLVANHAHKSDPFIIGSITDEKCIHYMANIDGVSSFQKKMSHLAAAYSKKKGLPDLQALKATFTHIRDGSPVGIFVEGDRSWDGETAPILSGTAGLIKKLNVPIWVVHLQGSYLSWPRWADNRAKGKLKLDYYVIPAEEVKKMTAEELESKLEKMIYQNDIKDKENLRIGFSGKKRASGIHRALWLCPDCGKHDSISATENKEGFFCSNCNKSWQLDGNLRISPHTSNGFEDLKDWLDWEKAYAKKQLNETEDENSVLTKTDRIQLKIRDKDKLEDLGSGSLSLFTNRIEFHNYQSGKIINFSPLKDIIGFIDNFNNYSEFTFHNKRYRLMFNDQNALKWIRFLEAVE